MKEGAPTLRMEDQDQIIEGVRVGDDALEAPPEEIIPVWGGAAVSENSKACMSLGPGFRVHSKIEEAAMQVEVEKGLVIMRWDQMNNVSPDSAMDKEAEYDADMEKIDPILREQIENKLSNKYDASPKKPSEYP